MALGVPEKARDRERTRSMASGRPPTSKPLAQSTLQFGSTVLQRWASKPIRNDDDGVGDDDEDDEEDDMDDDDSDDEEA